MRSILQQIRKLITFPKRSWKTILFHREYTAWVDELRNDKTQFIQYTDKPYQRSAGDVKIFAFYLPQFHSIPENDVAYGKGFTEWTNVASAFPQFVGHYQPKIPYDLGFYNVLQPGVMERQVEIAKSYGIYGFCFYYYWFSGKKLLEKPLEYFLHSNIDFHFHFCWANENWSKRWDGGNLEVIMEQHFRADDADSFFEDISPYVKDSRYEKIDGHPILTIYNPLLFEKEEFLIFTKRLNELAVQHGIPTFCLISTTRNGFSSFKEYGFDGAMEFPPNNLWPHCHESPIRQVHPYNPIKILDIHNYLANKQHLTDIDYPVFKTCLPSWDNTPRRAYSGAQCITVSDDEFCIWLSDIIQWTKKNNAPNKQIIYINAWNEWAEGAILEPTTRYGYKNLEMVKKCIEQNRTSSTEQN